MQQELDQDQTVQHGRHARGSLSTSLPSTADEPLVFDDDLPEPPADAADPKGIYGLNISPHHSRHHRRRVVQRVLVGLVTLAVIAAALFVIRQLL